MYWYNFLPIKSIILKVEAVKLEMIVAGLLRKSNFLMTSTYSMIVDMVTIWIKSKLVECQIGILFEKVRMRLLFGWISNDEVLCKTVEQLLWMIASSCEFVICINQVVLTEATKSLTLVYLTIFDGLLLSIIFNVPS